MSLVELEKNTTVIFRKDFCQKKGTKNKQHWKVQRKGQEISKKQKQKISERQKHAIKKTQKQQMKRIDADIRK